MIRETRSQAEKKDTMGDRFAARPHSEREIDVGFVEALRDMLETASTRQVVVAVGVGIFVAFLVFGFTRPANRAESASQDEVRAQLDVQSAVPEGQRHLTTFPTLMRRHREISLSVIPSLLLLTAAGYVAVAPSVRRWLSTPAPDGTQQLSPEQAVFAMEEHGTSEDFSDRNVLKPQSEEPSDEGSLPNADPTFDPMESKKDEGMRFAEPDVSEPSTESPHPQAVRPADSGTGEEPDTPGAESAHQGGMHKVSKERLPGSGERAAPKDRSSPGPSTDDGPSERSAGSQSAPNPHPEPEATEPVREVDTLLADERKTDNIDALLNDDEDVFGSIFNVEDLFDPFLRSMSESVADVDVHTLRRMCQSVNLHLQARHLLASDASEDEG